jgi:hypothetical protein
MTLPRALTFLLLVPALACTSTKTLQQPGDLVFTGMCDASAAVPLDDRRFVVADDEDNVLRAYDSSAPGPPLWKVDVSNAIGIAPKPGKAERGAPEADIEAATRIGALSFWMTSHGRNSSGKAKPERLRLFAASVPQPDEPLVVTGRAYEHLLDDLLAEPRLSRFGLREAAELPPKARGGLNLEGMTARYEGGVWIGFRNPVPDGLALLVPLLNPEQVVRDARARFGEPRLLDLGGRGVRAISHRNGRYLILAGRFDSAEGARLYTWDGGSRLERDRRELLVGLNPEGFFTPESGRDVLVLSDDGSLKIDGTECKRLADPARRRFRARWITP